MTTRNTSIEAYNEVIPFLSKKRKEIYDVLFNLGPMTSAEVFRHLNARNPVANITQSRARFTELREMGAILELGTKPCNVTGVTVILWDVDDGPVKKLEKKLTTKQKYEMCLESLKQIHTIADNTVYVSDLSHSHDKILLITENILPLLGE